MGIKDRRTKILLSLLLLSNDSSLPILYDENTCDIFDLTLNRKTLATFDDLCEEGLIRKTDESSLTYEIADDGYTAISLSFPIFRFTRSKWDGVFRILSYEIPEKKRELRDKLRREVASWGLGPWHRSFWITPHPIIPSLRKLVSDREEESYVQAFESTHVFGDKDVLIEKVWNKKSLEATYRTLFKKWHTILSKDLDKTEKMKQVVSEYVEIIKTDPGLPKQLIGENWIGFEAVQLFREIRDILLSNSK